ncbi:hypothetical protein GRI40_09275 [Altererythrobacter aerius]|uniref:Uncharacterized protein n=1 Tax=Tsuneonella aeria TaxID=1837929 RepID=A0A6I4TEB6_9SPHN|nr:hypothetical protein [Tsuneonella aeria]MXO75403.1 hypothetical protein [Tsuneonella aeria]
MGIVVVFLLGVSNFALHRAALESGHPMAGSSPWYIHLLGGRIALATEFLLLLAALLLVSQGAAWPVWAYVAYTALNAVGAWLIITRRV